MRKTKICSLLLQSYCIFYIFSLILAFFWARIFFSVQKCFRFELLGVGLTKNNQRRKSKTGFLDSIQKSFFRLLFWLICCLTLNAHAYYNWQAFAAQNILFFIKFVKWPCTNFPSKWNRVRNFHSYTLLRKLHRGVKILNYAHFHHRRAHHPPPQYNYFLRIQILCYKALLILLILGSRWVPYLFYATEIALIG